ncbi:hypothetical protein FKW77_010894 [Venturia effusa]|uniref:Uncharacterized protein n=1 Tax=Venturia effusa TaxID=50376 RepID=A0A517KYS9_9PEZI|nr:hypothetical protein FKW77_010894 [Venturia effusa]
MPPTKFERRAYNEQELAQISRKIETAFPTFRTLYEDAAKRTAGEKMYHFRKVLTHPVRHHGKHISGMGQIASLVYADGKSELEVCTLFFEYLTARWPGQGASRVLETVQ